MSKTTKGNPYRTGEVVVTPPNMAMPPEAGFIPFWEKELGLLYASNKDATKVKLSIGSSIGFELKRAVSPRKSEVRIAHNISNPLL